MTTVKVAELRKPFTKCIFLSTSSFNSSVILLLIPIEAKLIVHSLLNFPCAFHHFPKFSSWRVFAFWPLFQYFSLYRGSFMSLEKPLNPQYDEGMVLNQKKFSPATTNIAICHHHHFLSILYLTSSLRRANTRPRNFVKCTKCTKMYRNVPKCILTYQNVS